MKQNYSTAATDTTVEQLIRPHAVSRRRSGSNQNLLRLAALRRISTERWRQRRSHRTSQSLQRCRQVRERQVCDREREGGGKKEKKKIRLK